MVIPADLTFPMYPAFFGRETSDLAWIERVAGERRMLAPLVAWLRQQRRISLSTTLVEELPWLGRRIDLATLSTTSRTAAYELKLTNLSRALEQAAYNRRAFDRSYVVTASAPKPSNRQLASAERIGIIVVRDDGVQFVLESPVVAPLFDVKQRVIARIKSLSNEVPATCLTRSLTI